MDIYDLARMLAQASYSQWLTQEFLTVQWWILVGVLAVVYATWLGVLDKRIVKDLLLLGSLSSVGFIVADIALTSFLGLWEYKIAVLPVEPPIFMVSVTIAPIMFMLVHQYVHSWRSYTLWVVMGTAGLAFGLLPIYSLLGIFQLHNNWNYGYHFLLMLANGMIARAMLQGLTSVQDSQSSLHKTSFASLQPSAAKPMHSEDDDE